MCANGGLPGSLDRRHEVCVVEMVEESASPGSFWAGCAAALTQVSSGSKASRCCPPTPRPEQILEQILVIRQQCYEKHKRALCPSGDMKARRMPDLIEGGTLVCAAFFGLAALLRISCCRGDTEQGCGRSLRQDRNCNCCLRAA